MQTHSRVQLLRLLLNMQNAYFLRAVFLKTSEVTAFSMKEDRRTAFL